MPLSYYLHVIKAVNQTLLTLFFKKRPIISKTLALSAPKAKIRSPRFKRTLREVFANKPKSELWPGLVYGRLAKNSSVLRRPTHSVFPRELFHIKCLFDMEEFSLYDLFNFQKSTSVTTPVKAAHSVAGVPFRLNFFYKIRASIRVFRIHTLKFCKTSFNTEHRTNLFFKMFSTLSTLAYMWFFEFNLAVFLVKINFSGSIKQAHMLINTHTCSLNSEAINVRWALVKPGDLVQLPVSVTLFAWLRDSLMNKLHGTKRYAKLMERLFFRKRGGGVKGYKKKRALNMVWSKNKSFKFIEADIKTFSAFLLPYANNSVYFKLTLTLWLNYWNYRVTLWKYRT